MQEIIQCPQCNAEIITNSLLCSSCGTIIYESIILDCNIIEFMTTGTDPRLAPRSDSG